ncbi:MAG: 2-oxoglutarate dehydrogenase complex dihydrolipoyllysine-residue succinyltransferase [Gemmatimonadota bacterium]|nr:2-oxoglutarate dehydrogenase complex dihydrolipoyllysine-residue succinyltransferase [Gemmatimonadota bacterium]
MATDIVVPELGESVVEATVGTWFRKEGDPVSVGEPLVELETDKVNLEVSASTAGVLARIEQQEGVDVQIGDLLGVIDESAEAVATASEAGDAVQPEETPSTPPSEPEEPAVATDEATEHDDRVTPVARRMAEESGVDLAGIEGTGSGGRITKQDVERSATAKQQPMPEQKPTAPEPAPEAAEDIIPMSRRRRTIAKRLVEAQHTAAMLTTFNEIDMSTVISVRGSKKEAFEARHGVRLGFMSFFVKAAIGGLKDFPLLNAEIRDDNFVVKRHYDIGMAVGAEEGLVVPVLRAADQMSFADIEKTIRILAGKARDGSLAIEDLRGGTFTITNGGVFGSLLSTPILNPPQVGILGLHKIDERPIAINGEVGIRPMMYVALSYDHRIVDGSEAVRFLVRVKELIEDPTGLLLDG